MFASLRPMLLFLATAMMVGAGVTGHEPELQGKIPNFNEDAAIAKGQTIGIGTARLEGPDRVEVLSCQTWTLIYTAGPAGIEPGGGIRIGLRHLPYWSLPQTTDPAADGYFTAKAQRGQVTRIRTDLQTSLFGQYFAWQHLVEIVFPEQGLAAGESLQLVYGDRDGGSPGIRVQPFDESCFVFKTYVDARGDGGYLPLKHSPSIEIVAAEPHRLNLVMPSDAEVGRPTWCLVRAEDRYGNPASSYRGTVVLRCEDPSAALPEPYTFRESDRGVHRFEDVVFSHRGYVTVTAGDGRSQATGNPVQIAEDPPERLLLWGDLHGHTLMSDGRGTVEEYYDFAERVAGLDFCAVTDHAFEMPDEMWEHSKRVTNQACKPGRFVTFPAFEWSGTTPLGGDHNCYFLEDDPPLLRSTSYYHPGNLQMYHGPTPKQEHITDVFSELRQRLQDRNVFCVPHYGGRPGNPQWHDEKVQRMIEVFSEHRRSEDWAATFLERGHRLGIIASTDGHFGNPGYGYLKPTFDWDHQEIGMAAVAVYASQRTRESIFRALYDRRVYATSGDRIILDVRADEHPMGSEFSTETAPRILVSVIGTSPIAQIEIKKNGAVVHATQPQTISARFIWQDPAFDASKTCYYYVRVVQENREEAISSPVWVN